MLTLAGTDGLTVTNGTGIGDTTMTFTGRAVAVNAALDGLRYVPDAGYTGPAQVEVYSFLAGPGEPVKPDTNVVPVAVQAGLCAPRPRMQLQTATGGGQLLTTITPTTLNGGTPNVISELRFGTFANARVTLDGQSISSGQTVTLPPCTSQVSLAVERATPGHAATVPFIVVDNCGAWPTFVGGGSAAGL